MAYENKIEFYKNRTLGERFNAATDFLKQNWKALYKNVFYIAIPLSLVAGFAMQFNSGISYKYSGIGRDMSGALFSYIISAIYGVLLFSLTAAFLLKYEKDELTEDTGWKDLKGTLFSLFGKNLLISVGIAVVIIVLTMLLAVVAFSSGFNSSFFILFLAVGFYLAVLVALIPIFSLCLFPACFSGKNVVESIRIAIKLGFKNWGSLFVTTLLLVIIIFFVNLIFAIPYSAIIVLNGGEHNLLTFIFASIASFSSALTTPLMVVFLAFQYFSITETEEGISLQSQVDDFENL
jgi:hypothetical protein